MNATEKTIQDQLLEKFAPEDIEWRIGQAYTDSASVLAYITARGIMSRLDSIFGIMGWKDQYDILDKGVLCRLSVCIDGNWITKEDVAPYSHIEAFKGGVSDALKRAGVKFGIGRYLYDLPNAYVKLSEAKPKQAGYKTHKDKQNKILYWFPPTLPAWAVPGTDETQHYADSNDPNAPLIAELEQLHKRQINDYKSGKLSSAEIKVFNLEWLFVDETLKCTDAVAAAKASVAYDDFRSAIDHRNINNMTEDEIAKAIDAAMPLVYSFEPARSKAMDKYSEDEKLLSHLWEKYLDQQYMKAKKEIATQETNRILAEEASEADMGGEQ